MLTECYERSSLCWRASAPTSVSSVSSLAEFIPSVRSEMRAEQADQEGDWRGSGAAQGAHGRVAALSVRVSRSRGGVSSCSLFFELEEGEARGCQQRRSRWEVQGDWDTRETDVLVRPQSATRRSTWL